MEKLSTNLKKCKEMLLSEKSKKVYNWFLVILPWIWFAVCFVILCVFIILRAEYLLDSDMSSELVFADLITQEGRWMFSSNWIYSTEIRVVNFQLISVPLMYIFNDWNLVRILTSIISYVINLLCLFYFCKQVGLKKQYPIIASILMLPFSFDYTKFVLYGIIYYPYFNISLLLLGMGIQFTKTNFSTTKQKVISLLLMFCTTALSFLAGMQGLRQILVYFLPIILTAFLIFCFNKNEEQKTQKKKALLVFCISTFSAFVGYLINSKVLAKLYTFVTYGSGKNVLKFKAFSFSSLQNVLVGWLNQFGFETGAIFSISLIKNLICGICVILMILGCIHLFRHKDSYTFDEYSVSLFTIMAFLVYTVCYVFINMSYKDRYNLPVFIFFIPFIAIYLKKSNVKTFVKTTGVICLALLISISGISCYKKVWKIDNTAAYREVVSVLLENDCYNGYATFWNTAVLTELSDGKIEVWNWDYNKKYNNVNIDSIDHWLQKKDHETTHPQGKVFLLFTSSEMSEYKLPKLLDTNKIKYNSKSYTLFVYESYEELTSTQGIQTN